MGFHLMQQMMKTTGLTAREEMLRDAQNLMEEELEEDVSYSPTMHRWIYTNGEGADGGVARLRIYDRNNSSLTGNNQKFLTTHDNKICIGDYFHDTNDDTYWIVNESYNVDNVHRQGKMMQCNYLLKWQLSDGSIQERWCNIITASKYDTGEIQSDALVVTSNNYTVRMGYTEEAFELEQQRVFIDKKINNPEKVFKMTRDDDVLFDSGNTGGLLSFIASKTELDPDRDRPDLRLCDYHEPLSTHHPWNRKELSATIYGGDSLKCGIQKFWSVVFFDKYGTVISDIDFDWTWVLDTDMEIESSTIDNKILLTVNDESLIGNSFKLQIVSDEYIITESEITIVDVH